VKIKQRQSQLKDSASVGAPDMIRGGGIRLPFIYYDIRPHKYDANKIFKMQQKYTTKWHDKLHAELINQVRSAVSIPVIASSGAGRVEHFSEVFEKTGAEARHWRMGYFIVGKCPSAR